MNDQQTTSAAGPPDLRWIANDGAYFLPMAVFLLLTWIGGDWPSLYVISYVTKTLIAAVLIIGFWKFYTPISWRYSWLGAVAGVLGVAQWVGMEKLLHYPQMSHDVLNPFEQFHSPAATWAFIAIRWGGATMLVPVMEELFWRDYLWRRLAAPNDFRLASIGEWDRYAFIVVAVVFASVHFEWLTAIVWGVGIGALLLYTRSLGACIVCHAVTNFLLGAYVLWTHDWKFW